MGFHTFLYSFIYFIAIILQAFNIMLCIQLEGCPFGQGAPHRAEEGIQRNQGYIMGVMKLYT